MTMIDVEALKKELNGLSEEGGYEVSSYESNGVGGPQTIIEIIFNGGAIGIIFWNLVGKRYVFCPNFEEGGYIPAEYIDQYVGVLKIVKRYMEQANEKD